MSPSHVRPNRWKSKLDWDFFKDNSDNIDKTDNADTAVTKQTKTRIIRTLLYYIVLFLSDPYIVIGCMAIQCDKSR